VDVLVDSLGQIVAGTVVEVVPAGDRASHTFRVRIEVPSNEGVMSGMFGRARVPGERKSRLLVPKSATVEREGLKFLVVVTPESIAHLRLVTTGQSFGDRVEVLSGVTEGERVVVNNSNDVKDGDKVEVQK